MKALVCGGAGYIGSHMVRALRKGGHDVLVYDNLVTGHREAVGDTPLIEASLLDTSALLQAIQTWRPDVVFHFAAFSIVRDSIADPIGYYRNNVGGTIALLDAMRRADVGRIVFSSTAAVYGVPSSVRLSENAALSPINPYGSSKLVVERLLGEAATAYGLRSVSLRYFNAAGADPDGGIGESHEPETHLIPNVLRSAEGQSTLQVFGNDYDTPDGTCIRDYVHVNDLARAHLLAAEYLRVNGGAHSFNLGTGSGCSVMEIIDAVQRVTGRVVPFQIVPRRQGDPARLVAMADRAYQELGWSPALSDVDHLVDSAWAWHRNRLY